MAAKSLILVVDDEMDNAELVQRALHTRDDISTLQAYSGGEALSLLQSHTVDALVLDQRMPQMSGVELLERANALKRLPNAVMLTAFPEDPNVVSAHKRSLIRCILSKPWHAEDLLMAVDFVLKMPKRGR